jgi:hypothetical protein
MRLGLGVLAAAALLAGCAGGMREPPVPAGPPNLFLSPSGEPFRRSAQASDPVESWFAGADADRDGRLTSAEFAADAMRFFTVLDRDGDGRIDAFENQRYEREMVPEFSADPFAARIGPAAPPTEPDSVIRLPDRGRGGPPRGGPEGGLAGGFGARAASLTGDPQPVRAADSDLDQSVSQAEFRALTNRRFVALNLDRDSALTRAELPAPRILASAAGVGGGRGGRGGRRPPRR